MRESNRTNVGPGDNFTDHRKDTERERERAREGIRAVFRRWFRQKRGRFPSREHIHGTEPNGKWRLNYRLRRILRVCTAARGINVAAVVCVYRPKLTRARQAEAGDESGDVDKAAAGTRGARNGTREGDCEDGRRVGRH